MLCAALGEFFEFGLVLRRDGFAGVGVETGVFPVVENLDAFERENEAMPNAGG